MKYIRAEKFVDKLLESRKVEAVTATKHTGSAPEWGLDVPDVYWVLKGYPFDHKISAQLGWFPYQGSADDAEYAGLALLLNRKIVSRSDPDLGHSLSASEALVRKIVVALQKEIDTYKPGELDSMSVYDVISNVVLGFKGMK